MKSTIRWTLALAALVTVALALATPAAAQQMSSREKAFVEGLKRRGLLTLLETLLDDMEAGGADPMSIREQKAALFQMQGLQATNEDRRTEAFDKAEAAYRGLIDDVSAKAKAAQGREQDALRLDALNLKILLGELLWMHRPANQLNILELSDKELGDRAMVEKSMRDARNLFMEVRNETASWGGEMAADPEYERRYLNSGVYDKVSLYGEFAKYRTAWTDYYLGYALEPVSFNVEVTGPGTRPSEVVRVLAQETELDENSAADTVGNLPKTVAQGLDKTEAEALKAKLVTAGATAGLIPERDALLEEAVKLFTEFAELGDSREKWDSVKLLGMCHREQGLFDESVARLREAIEGASGSSQLKGSGKNTFLIQAYYEMVLAALKAKKFPDARAFLEELRQQNYPEFEQSFIGSQLMPYIDAKIDLSDPTKKAEGLNKMRDLWRQSGPLQMIISAEIRKHIDLESRDLKSMQPFELWILADETYVAKDFAKAAKYFEQYIEITQADDPTHREAMFNLAVCYYRLAQIEDTEANEVLEFKNKAANRFFEVASRFPDFHSVGRAAESFVLLRSELYVDNPTQENLDKYSAALKWSLQNRTESAEAADMRWLYGNVLQKQGKYVEAAQQFERVDENVSPNFYEAKYLAATCYRLDLLDVKWPTLKQEDIPQAAAETVTKMEEYANWATAEAKRAGANGSTEAASTLKENAGQMLIWAAEILSLEQVRQFERSLRLLDQCEQSFPKVAAEQKGAILKVKIYDYIAQNLLDKVTEILEQFVNSAKPEEVEPVLTDLFDRISEDIDRLIRQDRKEEVRTRVLPLADQIGSFFVKYLGDVKRETDVPFVLYQLAEMHRRAEDFEGSKGAIQRYLKILGFDPFEKREELSQREDIDIAHIRGLAESTYAVTQVSETPGRTLAATAPKRAYDYLKRSEFYWGLVCDGYDRPMSDTSATELKSLWWDAKYSHLEVLLALHPLEQRLADEPIDYQETVRGFIQSFQASSSDFGGAASRVKFGRLARQLGIRWP